MRSFLLSTIVQVRIKVRQAPNCYLSRPCLVQRYYLYPYEQGVAYLTTVMDWYSRYVLSWEVSVSLDTEFCVSDLESSLRRHGRPETFNTDQGCQFKSHEFTDVLKNAEVLISMDGKGRALDNVFIERLWRSVKYEDVYLKQYPDVQDLVDGLSRYFTFYNTVRPHTVFSGHMPEEVYFCHEVRVGH